MNGVLKYGTCKAELEREKCLLCHHEYFGLELLITQYQKLEAADYILTKVSLRLPFCSKENDSWQNNFGKIKN